MIVLSINLFKSGNETKKVSQLILSPDSMVGLESPPPSASSTNSEIAAIQQSMDSCQEQVLESELIIYFDLTESQ